LEISPELLLEIWKKGKTLNQSIYQFTDAEILSEHENIELKFKEFNSKNLQELLSDIAQGVTQLNQFSTKVKDSFEKIKRNLLNIIISEKLIGLGYEAPVKSSDYPKIIPLHIWPLKINEINWDDSSISRNGIEFLNIRIIKKSALNNKISKKEKTLPKTKIVDKKPGRPTIKNKIIAAYTLLKKEEKIDYLKNFKSHTESIQKTVRQLNPELKDNKGLGVEVIRRAVKPMFDDDSKTSKSTSKL